MCGWGRQFCPMPLSLTCGTLVWILVISVHRVHQRPLIWSADGRRCTLITQLQAIGRFRLPARLRAKVSFLGPSARLPGHSFPVSTNMWSISALKLGLLRPEDRRNGSAWKCNGPFLLPNTFPDPPS